MPEEERDATPQEFQPVEVSSYEEVAEFRVEEVPVPSYAPTEPKYSLSSISWFGIGRFCMYALAVLTPLFFLPVTVAPVDVNKLIFAVILLGVSFVAFLVDAIDNRKIHYPRSFVAIMAAAVVGVVGISTLFSVAPRVSVYGALSQPDSFLSFVLYGLAFFLSFYFFRREDLKQLAISVSAVLAAIAAITALEFAGLFIFPWDFAKQIGFNTVGSFAGLGIVCATAFVMIVSALYHKQSFGKMQQFFVGLSLVLLVLLACMKMPLLWVGIGLLVLVAAGVQFAANRSVGVLLAIIATALFFVIVDPYLPQLSTVPTEIRPSISSSFSVVKATVTSWRFAFGTGPATYPYTFSLYRSVDQNQLQLLSYTFLQGYNFWLTSIVTVGTIGVLIFVLFLLVSGFRLLRNAQDPAVATLAAGLLFCTVALFLFPVTFVQMLFLFVGLGLALRAIGLEGTVSFADMNRGYLFMVFVVGIAIIAGSLSGGYLIMRSYAAAVYYGSSLQKFAAGDLSGGFEKLNRAVTLDNTSDIYWRTASQALLLQARQLISQGKPGATNQNDLQASVYQAVQSALRATQINSKDPLNWSNLGNIYENIIPIATGADQNAVDAYKKAIELNPKNPQEPVNMARALLTAAVVIENAKGPASESKSRVVQALEALKISESIAPNYAPANFSLVQLYIKQGDTQKAAAKIQEIQALSPLDAGLAYQLGLIAYQNNQPEIAQAQFERAVSLYPDYSNALYLLGVIYDAKGAKTQARAAFERVLQLNPDNDEIKKILDSYQSTAPPANASSTKKK